MAETNVFTVSTTIQGAGNHAKNADPERRRARHLCCPARVHYGTTPPPFCLPLGSPAACGDATHPDQSTRLPPELGVFYRHQAVFPPADVLLPGYRVCGTAAWLVARRRGPREL